MKRFCLFTKLIFEGCVEQNECYSCTPLDHLASEYSCYVLVWKNLEVSGLHAEALHCVLRILINCTIYGKWKPEKFLHSLSFQLLYSRTTDNLMFIVVWIAINHFLYRWVWANTRREAERVGTRHTGFLWIASSASYEENTWLEKWKMWFC
jgi:hypothetical protein